MYIGGGGVRIPGEAFPVAAGSAFSGNFATLFPGAYQVVQTDLGLTYGGTMRASGTTPPVITLTGALVGSPVPIRITVGVTGALGVWTFQVSYDGGGTIAQVGTSAATVPLVGAGLGLSINIAAGNAAGDNVWLATCSALADQSGNALDYTQATANNQPVVGVGLNGKASLIGNGVSMLMGSSFNAPTPGITPYYTWAVFREVSFTLNRSLFGHGAAGNNSNVYFTGTSTNMIAFNGASVTNAGVTVGSWLETERVASNNAADTFKVGPTTVSGNAGNLGCTGTQIFASGGGTIGNFELLALAFTPNLPDWAAVRAAINGSAGYGVGNVGLCV